MSTKSLYLLSCLLIFILCVFSLSIGVANFHWANLLSGQLNSSAQILFISRLPRTLALILTGASTAVAGMIMQILLKNRFVEPSMVGASQSTALGLLLITLIFPAATLFTKMSVAALSSLLGMLLFMAMSRRLPPSAQLLLPLIGIVWGGIIDAIATFIAYEYEMMQLLSIWQSGDFSGVLLGRYELLWLTGILAILAYIIADQLTIMGLGETVAANLGLNRQVILWSGLIIVSLITALVVVTVGSIPFIGLVIPNIVSRLLGDKLRASLPAVALLGATMVLFCDILGRLIVFPFEIPVSTVFGVVGTLLFLYLLMRTPKPIA